MDNTKGLSLFTGMDEQKVTAKMQNGIHFCVNFIFENSTGLLQLNRKKDYKK